MQSEAKNNLFYRSEIIRSKLNETDRILFFGIVSDKENASLYSDNVKKLMNFESVNPEIILSKLNRLEKLFTVVTLGLYTSKSVISTYKPLHNLQEQQTNLKQKIYTVITNFKQWSTQKFINSTNSINHCQKFMLNQLEMIECYISRHNKLDIYKEEICNSISELIEKESDKKWENYLIEVVLVYIPPNRNGINEVHQEAINAVYGFYSVGAETMFNKVPVFILSSDLVIHSGIIDNPGLIDYIKAIPENIPEAKTRELYYQYRSYIEEERKKLVSREYEI